MLVLILLTSLDGSPLWVETSQISAIRPAHSQCKEGNGAAIRVGPVAYCVKETPDEIRQKMQEAEGAK